MKNPLYTSAHDALALIYANEHNGRDVESWDNDTDEQVTVIRVKTQEPITPAYLAMRIAQACAARGALREGESVSADGLEFIVGPQEQLTWPPATEPVQSDPEKLPEPDPHTLGPIGRKARR